MVYILKQNIICFNKRPPITSPSNYTWITSTLRPWYVVISIVVISSTTIWYFKRITKHIFSFIHRRLSIISEMHGMPTYFPNVICSYITSQHTWLNSNSLQVNPTKTETIFLPLFMWSTSLPNSPLINCGSISIPCKKYVRNLGFHFETTILLDNYISQIYKAIHYHLHCFFIIRASLLLYIVVNIISSLWLLKLPYLQPSIYKILQTLQNAVVWCILPTTPLRKQLHWLPITYYSIHYTKLFTKLYTRLHFFNNQSFRPINYISFHLLNTNWHCNYISHYLLLTTGIH